MPLFVPVLSKHDKTGTLLGYIYDLNAQIINIEPWYWTRDEPHEKRERIGIYLFVCLYLGYMTFFTLIRRNVSQ